MIYPATDAHIAKYSFSESYFLIETYEDWINKTSEHIKKKAFDLTVSHFNNNKIVRT